MGGGEVGVWNAWIEVGMAREFGEFGGEFIDRFKSTFLKTQGFCLGC